MVFTIKFDSLYSHILLLKMIPVSGITFWKRVCMPLTQCTTQILSTKQKELQGLKWTDGEANTESGFSKLGCESAKEAWNDIKVRFPEYKDITLTFTSPDINITISIHSNDSIYAKIELKSGKGKIIPGSTIGKLDINQPTIFCLRKEGPEQTFEFRYSQYHRCIGEKDTDMFQDRTPRPFVNYDKMTGIDTPLEYIEKEKGDWIEHYANCAVFRIEEGIESSWQDTLTKIIMKKAIDEYIKKTSVEEFAKRKSELQ